MQKYMSKHLIGVKIQFYLQINKTKLQNFYAGKCAKFQNLVKKIMRSGNKITILSVLGNDVMDCG